MPGRRGRLRGVVEHFQCRDERSERVGAKQPHRRRDDPGHPLLPILDVNPAGAAQREAVDRPVPCDVGAVARAQAGAKLRDLAGVLQRRGLCGQELSRAVAQPEELSQLGAVRPGHVEGLVDAVAHDGERSVALDGEVPVPEAL